MPIDRLTAQDMGMLWPDDFGWPQDIGAFGVLDGAGLVDPDGRFRIEPVRAAIGSRLPLVPRFRQVIRVPRLGLAGGTFVSLPVGEADAARRLRMVARETATRRRMSHPAAGTLMPNAVLQRMFLRRMAHQRWVNTYLGNVPGPAEPLRIAGASVLELFPLVPLIGNVTLGVGALSYAGQFNLTVVADADACPDADVFTHGPRTALGGRTRAFSSDLLG